MGAETGGMEQDLIIRNAKAEDAARLAEIYNHYIRNTIITFEVDELTADDFADRLKAHPENLPWLVIEEDGNVVGYCYAGPWKQRSAYAHSVEASIYLDEKACGKGLGKRAYSHLLSKISDYHAIVGGIALPNAASVALHEALGFQKVAHFSEIGRKFDRWIDVGYWQLLPGKGLE
jgi:L-amino acid N-acyltransferase YncA